MWPLWVGPTILGTAYPLDDRSNAVLAFTQRLYQFPLGVFGVAIATAIFPALSEAAGQRGAEPAEQSRLDRMRSPRLTPEVFEAFLPYAFALGVENNWCTRFAREFPREVESGNAYTHRWYIGNRGGLSALHHMGHGFGSAFSGAISSASSPPGSSSGSGGGGFSGGGGGGGGGGGW